MIKGTMFLSFTFNLIYVMFKLSTGIYYKSWWFITFAIYNPIIASSKCINLTVAMISMISLEVAMIYQFGDNDSSFKVLMTFCTGFGVYAINSFMAIYMIVKANKNLKRKVQIDDIIIM